VGSTLCSDTFEKAVKKGFGIAVRAKSQARLDGQFADEIVIEKLLQKKNQPRSR